MRYTKWAFRLFIYVVVINMSIRGVNNKNQFNSDFIQY